MPGRFDRATGKNEHPRLQAIVTAAGASLNDVVKATIFLTDLSHFALVNKVMAEYFKEPYPARAAVGRIPCDFANTLSIPQPLLGFSLRASSKPISA